MKRKKCEEELEKEGRGVLLKPKVPDEDKTFLKAFFLGRDKDIDDLILRYVGYCGNGVCYPSLELYFIYKNSLCTVQRLRKRLITLVKLSLLKDEVIRSTHFYTIRKEEDKGVNDDVRVI